MSKLDEKVAIVTGAARGLGRAYAKRLAGLGAKVAVADLNLHSYEADAAPAARWLAAPRTGLRDRRRRTPRPNGPASVVERGQRRAIQRVACDP